MGGGVEGDGGGTSSVGISPRPHQGHRTDNGELCQEEQVAGKGRWKAPFIFGKGVGSFYCTLKTYGACKRWHMHPAHHSCTFPGALHPRRRRRTCLRKRRTTRRRREGEAGGRASISLGENWDSPSLSSSTSPSDILFKRTTLQQRSLKREFSIATGKEGNSDFAFGYATGEGGLG